MARVRLSKQQEPSTPPNGFGTFYIDDDTNTPSVKTDDGNVHPLGNVSSPSSPSENAIARFTSSGGLNDSAANISDSGDISTSGQGIFGSVVANNGATGTFTSQDSKTVTVVNGIITSIV